MSFLEELSSALSLINISDKEIRVYSCLVGLGQADASKIAKRADLPRTTTYSILERLVDRGLVSQTRRPKGALFIPSSPSTIVNIAEERYQEAKDALNVSKVLSKRLESINGRDSFVSPKIEIFEGKVAITRMLNDRQRILRASIIENKSAWLGFQDDSFLVNYGQTTKAYWEEFKDAQDREKDILKLFSNDTETEHKVHKEVKKHSGDRRVLRPLPKKFKFSGTIWICGEYLVAMRTRANPHYAIIIRDKVLAENTAIVFECLWDITS